MNTDADEKSQRVTIVGAGLAGVALAALLARAGQHTNVVEQHPDPRHAEVPKYPSINLALSYRGLKLLSRLRIIESLGDSLIPMAGRLIHDGRKEQFQPYDLVGERQIFSVQRRRLIAALLDTAQAAQVKLEFGRKVTHVDLENRTLAVRDAATGEEQVRPFRTVIGADGCHSVVRKAIDVSLGQPSQISTLDHGYYEILIPASHAAGLRLNALHIWPRYDFMLIALPNPDGSFTATLFLPLRGPNSFESMQDRGGLDAFFRQHLVDAVRRFPSLEHRETSTGVGRIVTLLASNWFYDDRAVVLGDAAHSIAPFLGQGVNCAFEDCELFADLVAENGDWRTVFTRLQATRRGAASVVADLSLDNYLEMRKSVRQTEYLARREFARRLQTRFPEQFVPLYSMVSFSDLPYVQCLARHRAQERIIDALLPQFRSDRLDWNEAARLVGELPGQRISMPEQRFWEGVESRTKVKQTRG